jgi:hypothetical protein
MKIITRAVLDWDGNVLEQDAFEYSGPVGECKSSGSAPQPVDPYTQAAAQQGLAENTAGFNAALNHSDSSNAMGSNTWQITGHDPTTGAPIYSQQTSLAPQFQSMLDQPIDTSGIPGMPGGPSEQQNVNDAEHSVFDQQMALLQPQQQMQTEQTQAQLENSGAMPGSAAYEYGTNQLARQQGATNAQVANSAVTTGMGELPMLYGLGSTSLQNQLAARNAPISEYESLAGNPSGQVSAATPDISGAFNQQYQGALGGYNANVATNNANTQAGAGLASMLAMMAFLA